MTSEPSLYMSYTIKGSSSIGLDLSSSSVEIGNNMHVTGTLTFSRGTVTAPIGGATVRLSVTLPDGSVVYPTQGAKATTNSAGEFSIDYVPLAAGIHSFKATYSNTRYYSGSTSTVYCNAIATPIPEPVTPTGITLSGASTAVNGLSTSIDGLLKATTGTAISGATVSVEVTNPDGSMTGPSTVITNANGGFTYSITPSMAGTYAVKATFAGNAQYGASLASMQFTATAPLPPAKVDVVVTASGTSSVQVGSPEQMTGFLRTTSGAAIGGAPITAQTTAPDGSVSQVVSITTASDGSFAYSLTPSTAGSHTVTVVYAGSSAYNPASGSFSFTAVQTSIATYDYIVSSNVVKNANGQTMYTGSSFTSALAWAAMQTGKVVYVPRGTYDLTTSISPSTGVTLRGDGDDGSGTNLRFTATTYQNARIWINGVSNVELSGLRITGGCVMVQLSGVTCTNIVLKDITWYQTPSFCPGAFWTYVLNAGTIDGLSLYRCNAIDAHCMGFALEGEPMNQAGGEVRQIGGWIKNVLFQDCSATGCGVVAPRYNEWVCGFDLAEGVNVQNLHLVGCTASGNYMDGFHIEMWPWVYNCVFDNCTANNNGIKGQGCGIIYTATVGTYLSMPFGGQQVTLNNFTATGNKSGNVVVK